MTCQVDQNGDEIFIVDDEIVTEFFKSENFENAQMFFDYLTIKCKTKKAFMIPCIFTKITDKLKEKTAEKGDKIQTEILSYFENWIEKAELFGEEQGEEEHDTLLLYKILKVLNPDKKVIVLSSKYTAQSIDSLSIDGISRYLLSKANFKEYLRQRYGLDDGASY